MCYLRIKLVFSKLQCCSLSLSIYIYICKHNLLYFFFKLKCNLLSIFHGAGPRGCTWGGPGDVLLVSASLMSVQFKSRTPSVDPAVENYFCNAVHLECEVSDPPRDVSMVARWRPRKRSRVLWSGSNCLAKCPN